MQKRTHAPDDCRRCTPHTVCTTHEQHATTDRPAARTLHAVIARDEATATGTGNPIGN